MPLQIAELASADHAAWGELALGYKTFYEANLSAAEYAVAWDRLLRQDQVCGLGAKRDGVLVGISHHLYHSSTWRPRVCYLQDLFVLPSARGQGVARQLIAAVAAAAVQAGADRLYWLTHEHNVRARRLYDQVAHYDGFIRYDLTLP